MYLNEDELAEFLDEEDNNKVEVPRFDDEFDE